MLEGFAWLRNHSQAYCVTFAQGLDQTELIDRFGGDLAWARPVERGDWGKLDELELFGQVIQVGWCGGWAFVYEDNGLEGMRPEVLHRVSAGTRAVSVFRNVNGVRSFCLAEDGSITVDFEPSYRSFEEDIFPHVRGRLAWSEIQAAIGHSGSQDVMFILAEAAGVRFDQQAIEGSLLSTFLRNPFSDFVNDLLTHGGKEQTSERLLTFLGDQRRLWQRKLICILDGGRIFLDGGHIMESKYREGQYNIRGEQQREHLDTIGIRIAQALHSVQIIPPLLDALREGSQTLRSAVSELLQALIRLDQRHDEEGARERLLLLSFAPEPAVARHAAFALGELGDQRAIDLLLRVLSFSSDERQAVHLLGQFRASRTVEPLLKLLNPQDENISFQRALFKALKQIGDTSIVERLMPWLNPLPAASKETSFQQELLALLVQLGDFRLTDRLLALLDPHLQSSSFDFQLHLLKALGNLGDRRVIEPLARRLLLDVSTCPIYEYYFQLCLVKALRQLGDTRAELEIVEASLQSREKTLNLRMEWLSR